MRILNADMIERALKIAEPVILLLMNDQYFFHRPGLIVGYISVLGLGPLGRVPFQFGKDDVEVSIIESGNAKDLCLSALHKHDTSLRERCSTSDIADTRPWCLDPGESLHPGGVYRDGMVVAVAGAGDRANEAIAEIIISIIRMLSFMEKDQRVEQGKMDI